VLTGMINELFRRFLPQKFLQHKLRYFLGIMILLMISVIMNWQLIMD